MGPGHCSQASRMLLLPSLIVVHGAAEWDLDDQGTSLVVQWLRLQACTAGGTDSIPGQGTKIPHAAQCGRKKKKEKKIWMTRITRQVIFPYYFLSHVICMSVIKSNVEHLSSHPTQEAEYNQCALLLNPHPSQQHHHHPDNHLLFLL